ncbi:MAG: pilus assembly protein PilP [Acidobacteria bacterium]|nr:pilus assembly protein PilP [Acidobacteriota bacterium]
MRAIGGVMIVAFGLALQAQAPAPAQDPAGPPPADRPAAGTPQAPGAQAPPPADTYTYDPAGRRDPFVSLLNGGVEPHESAAGRPDGPASMTVGEISVRGVVETRGELIAMIKGPDNKTYLVHQGDRLLDGVIKSITPQGLVVLEEVNDPLSLVKQREVRKMLRSAEGVQE